MRDADDGMEISYRRPSWQYEYIAMCPWLLIFITSTIHLRGQSDSSKIPKAQKMA